MYILNFKNKEFEGEIAKKNNKRRMEKMVQLYANI